MPGDKGCEFYLADLPRSIESCHKLLDMEIPSLHVAIMTQVFYVDIKGFQEEGQC